MNQEPLRTLIERIDIRTANIDVRVERIEKAVFIGNGTPPVLARLAVLEERSRTQGRLIAAVIGAAIGVFFPK